MDYSNKYRLAADVETVAGSPPSRISTARLNKAAHSTSSFWPLYLASAAAMSAVWVYLSQHAKHYQALGLYVNVIWVLCKGCQYTLQCQLRYMCLCDHGVSADATQGKGDEAQQGAELNCGLAGEARHGCHHCFHPSSLCHPKLSSPKGHMADMTSISPSARSRDARRLTVLANAVLLLLQKQ
ncbi:MAG: hypothetical protein FRX49_03033 [Trebouxia sp. A1-2]|nr:MAG: hypothetical protein FRX49_03033 [Trebouxia sp. A1-2]